MHGTTRRQFGATLLSSTLLAASPQSMRTISMQPDLYHGWPTVARRRNGDLVLAWSGDREAHVCPFGRVCYAVSRDEGSSWTWPRILMDSGTDDRDAGVVETERGSLLVTTFTSYAYEPILQRARREGKWPADRLARWEAAHNRLDAEQRKKQLGCWMLRSTDGGLTWSTPYQVPLNSPHGPIAISGGKLLYAGKDLWGEGKRVGISQSSDDGVTWSPLAELPIRAGDRAEEYHELHAIQAPSGRLIVQIRNHNEASRGETLQCESSDGGKTWTTPRSIGVWGLPSHLLRLRDGRLLMTYGYRRAPFGNQARISKDEGRTWSEPITVSADGASGDLGYPSTVELADGSLLSVWYELLSGSTKAVLRQARWKVS
jgi:hypothetical protein